MFLQLLKREPLHCKITTTSSSNYCKHVTIDILGRKQLLQILQGKILGLIEPLDRDLHLLAVLDDLLEGVLLLFGEVDPAEAGQWMRKRALQLGKDTRRSMRMGHRVRRRES